MKAAIVQGAGLAPAYADFPEPVPGEGERLVKVRAAALTQLARGRASGAHYSASGAYPFIAGVDGVGRLEDGARVYFLLPRAPYGAFAEETVVAAQNCLRVPEDLDDVTAAAIANPGMSSWAALTERARLVAGETVLVNGATGASGRLAVQIARRLGAKRVIATGRNPAALAALETLGADATIALGADERALEARFRDAFAAGVDVVLDYLWGRSAELLLSAAAAAAAKSSEIRFVQIGALTGGQIPFLADVLRSTPISIMGSGLGSVPAPRLLAAIAAVLAAATPAGLAIAARAVPLADVGAVWGEAEGARAVFVP
ncbi:NADPH:quinone reductase-like Zn-dependent oxidoreductase [Roseiarcus fermentans]|uniref:NADPH:quinone reductase-like Zn-dependent oxidoreductase n=1 Tax=Roseiarcus fermentans TaxID=1473586 RepID=A0A366FXF7_9HYPH|nr:zinc-binding alcohol dehydrogenase family protein [Roseiarcus fermentans]RBP18389.1 NADPH:quinone reductase-like Zn-dependent oxidoreductase [Roseiarcus fermentans]